MPDVNIRWLNRRLIWIVVALAASVSLLVALATVLVVTTQASNLARTNAIGGCDGVNLIRGDARLLTHRDMPTKPDDRNLTDWLLRLRNCPATYDQGRIVIVPASVEFRYLKLLAARHRVAIRHDAAGWHFLPMA
jgi:hypothetical protein